MENLVKVINEIKSESSRTGKEAILKSYEDNELFRYVLRFVYNTFIVTGLSTRKINKKVDIDIKDNHRFTRIDDVLRYLKTNNTGRDYDIAVMQSFIETLSNDDTKDIAKQIITKSLKIGITEKTINKVYGKNEIPSFAVMLAHSYEQHGSKLVGDFYITKKLDGNRCIVIKDEDEVKFFTRRGQPIEGLNDLTREIMALPNGTVLDGELLLENKDNLSTNDLFRATQRELRKDGVKKDVRFYVFDILSLKEFQDGKSTNTYEDRREKLESIFSMFEFNLIESLPTLYKGNDKNVISVLLKYALEKGWEGLMVNTADGLYQCKRTYDLLKVKEMKSADLLVMSLEEGEGRNKGRLGRANVEYKGSLVGVGSGFSDEERDRFWKNPDEIVGKVIEVQFFQETTDEKSGQPSLLFPVFKHIRHDKGVEDINYEG